MGRPVGRKTSEVWLKLPHDLVASLDLLLFSEVQGRVPYNARNKVMEELLRKWLERGKDDRELARRIASSVSPRSVISSFLAEQGYPFAGKAVELINEGDV